MYESNARSRKAVFCINFMDSVILSKEEDTMKPDIEKLRKNTWITHQKECLPWTFAA